MELSQQLIPVALIDANPLNPRRHFSAESIADLGASLRSSIGQLEPIRVRPSAITPGRFELVDGERRWRAAKEAGPENLYALVGPFSDADVLTFSLTSGSQRAPLNAVAEARGFADLMQVEGLDQTEMAHKLGRSQQHISKRLALLSLPQFAIDAIEEEKLPVSVANEIVRVATPEIRDELAGAVLRGAGDGSPLSLRDTIELVRQRTKQLEPTSTPSPSAPTAGAELFVSPEINAEIYPPGEAGISWKCDYVEFARRVPSDLLKPEVLAPKWAELVGDRVMIELARDQGGVRREVIRLGPALLAVPASEHAIFREEVIRKYGMKGEFMEEESNARVKPSRKSEEEAERKARRAADRLREKRDRAGAAWLVELRSGIDTGDPTRAYALWSLLFDLALSALTPEEMEFVGRVIGHEYEESEGAPSTRLKGCAGALSTQGLCSFVCVMLLAPRVRVEGVDTVLAREWHDTFLAPVGASESSDVDLDALRESALEMFDEQGLHSDDARDRLVKFATGVATLEQLTHPDQFDALRRVLSSNVRPAIETEEDDS